MSKPKIGVIIGRFQVDYLHEGHMCLLKTASKASDEVVILVGTQPQKPLDSRDPLPFTVVKDMLTAYCVENGIRLRAVVELPDQPTDKQWSEKVDKRIAMLGEHATIYTGRSDTMRGYSGVYTVNHIHANGLHTITGTALRAAVSPDVDPRFRRGMIYAANQQPPTVFPTVDIALRRGREVLLGRKPGETKWRLPGGFVDVGDRSFEQAAVRELREECGGVSLEIGNPQYVGTFKVNDWRYRSSPHKVITTVYTVDYYWGHVQAGDDLAEVEWFAPSETLDVIDPIHLPLLQAVFEKGQK